MTCYICGIINENVGLQDLDNFLKAQHNCNKLFRCNKCNYQSNNDAEFQIHKANHLLKCNICYIISHDKDSILNHKILKHTRKFEIKLIRLMQCRICDTYFESKSKFINHTEYQHASTNVKQQFKGSHQCSLCHRSFEKHLQKKIHQKFFCKNDSTNEKVDLPKLDEIVSIQVEEIKTVNKVGQDKKRHIYICKLCGEVFHDSNSFESHFERNHFMEYQTENNFDRKEENHRYFDKKSSEKGPNDFVTFGYENDFIEVIERITDDEVEITDERKESFSDCEEIVDKNEEIVLLEENVQSFPCIFCQRVVGNSCEVIEHVESTHI